MMDLYALQHLIERQTTKFCYGHIRVSAAKSQPRSIDVAFNRMNISLNIHTNFK